MRLEQLGWSPYFASQFASEAGGCVPARVAEENKGFFRVLAERGDYLAQIAGKIRYHADRRSDFPAVGDWVVIQPRPAENRASVVAILRRHTILSRKTAGRVVDQQILATNVDAVFVVTALDQEFKLRRVERYLALVWESGGKPVVLLNKADLCAKVEAVQEEVERAAPGVPVHALSATEGQGLGAVRQYLIEGRTGAFIGSSGVGKSTIINALAEQNVQRAQPVRASDHRGRHTTTSRQMILLPGGGVVIDTPGMRELQLWESDAGLARAFDDLEALAQHCKFRDCSHSGEPGCAIARAIAAGEVEGGRLANYHKMERELRFLDSKTDLEARQRAKQRARQMCKAYKRGPKKY